MALRTLIALDIAVIALAIGAGAASAATTRAEWVAQVDPVCQNGQTQEAVALQPLKRAAKRMNKHRDAKGKSEKKLARLFSRYLQQYTSIERAVNAQIATIPPAPDDVSLVQVWLRARGELLDLENQVFTGGLKPKKGLKGLGQVFTQFFQLIGRSEEASDLVRDFGFTYCNQTNDEVQFIG